jgi:hypothetical protein
MLPDGGLMDARSRRRAGRQVKQRLRGEIRAVARRSWRMLVTALAMYALVAGGVVAVAIAMGRTHFAAFVAGLMLGGVGLLWQAFLIGQGFAHRQIGGEAEQWTATELAKLDERAWRVYHDVPLRYGNIDHVVVGPGRVYAVETKWSGARDKTRFLTGGARQAARNAKELEEIFAVHGCCREVLPILVVWGGGVADALGETPQMWSSTRVVAGHHSDVWLDRIRQAQDRLELDWPAQQVVEQLILADHAEPDTAAAPST